MNEYFYYAEYRKGTYTKFANGIMHTNLKGIEIVKAIENDLREKNEGKNFVVMSLCKL